MKRTSVLLIAFAAALIIYSFDMPLQANKNAEANTMMVRLSEIEIDPAYLDEYKAILKEESAASVRLEPGVIAIYPMQQLEDSTQIRILEIYANKEGYQAHLQTPHFQKYKTTTLKMVKALRLVDMAAIDTASMASIFSKFKK